MNTTILLGTGPPGLVTNPRSSKATDRCNFWMDEQIAQGVRVLVPEIADYELRRELIRAGKIKGIAKLNELKRSLGYIPINTWTMLKAAEYCAQARGLGKPTSLDAALDAHVILAAQAAFLKDKGHTVIVATSDPKHLEMFVDARDWSDIV